MNSHISRIAAAAVLAFSALLLITLSDDQTHANEIISEPAQCTSGAMTANLTGWTLNNVFPKGEAVFNAKTKQLKVKVSSVKLDDGTSLKVEADGDEAGSLPALKDGAAEMSFTISKSLDEGDRVRVVDDERPIVSGDLVCSKAPAPTPEPSAEPEPTAAPNASPSPETSPAA